MARTQTITMQILLLLLAMVHIEMASCIPVAVHEVVEPGFVSRETTYASEPLAQEKSTGSVNLTGTQKLAIGLGVGLGGILLISMILCFFGYKNKWHRNLPYCGSRIKISDPLPPPTSAMPHHPLYRASLGSANHKSPGSHDTTNTSYYSYHPHVPSPVTSYFQPVEVYRTLMVPDGVVQGATPTSNSGSPGSSLPPRNPLRMHTNGTTPSNLQPHRSPNPEANSQSQSPITRYTRLSIHSPQPRRVGLPISPRYGLESGLGVACPPPARVRPHQLSAE